MGAELSPLTGVESTFEKCAEDGRLDLRPVKLADPAEEVDFHGIEMERW
jgi:hypothetical protein